MAGINRLTREQRERAKQRAALEEMGAVLEEWKRPQMAGRVPRTVPKLYRAVVLALAGRIVQCGLTMEQCDDRSGVQDRYTAKLLHPDAAQGRVAGWETLQCLMDVLYPHGVEVVFVPLAPGAHDPAAHPRPNRAAMTLLGDIAAELVERTANDDNLAPARRLNRHDG